MRRKFVSVVAAGIACIAAAGLVAPAFGQPYGYGHGMMGHGMMGGGMMGGGSAVRHHWAMMNGIPAPYASMRNPTPGNEAAVAQGATVYRQNCVFCHGATGTGDGPAGRKLNPPPSNLLLRSQTPMGQWDQYLYWTIAEGGKKFDTAMPSFKEALAPKDIWAVIDYIEAGLPPSAGDARPHQ